MNLIKEIRKYPLQILTLGLSLFTLYLFLFILGRLHLGFYTYLAGKISSILSNPFAIILGVLGIDSYFWAVWKKIPISILTLVSFVYLFLIGLLIPITYQKIKDDYNTSK